MNGRDGRYLASGGLVGLAVGLWVLAQFCLLTEMGDRQVHGLWATLLGWVVDPIAWSANVWFVAAIAAWASDRLRVAGFLAMLALLCSAPWVYRAADGVAAVCAALWFHGSAESQCATVGLGPGVWFASFVVLALAVAVRRVVGDRASSSQKA